eukprot:161310-Amphidinium_carterae.1
MTHQCLCFGDFDAMLEFASFDLRVMFGALPGRADTGCRAHTTHHTPLCGRRRQFRAPIQI